MTRITKEFTNFKCINLLYNALIRSQLEYCSVVWNPHHKIHINTIERVQKKYTRHIYYKRNLDYQSYECRLGTLKLCSMEKRRQYFDLCMLYEFIHNGSSDKIILRENNYVNRHNALFHPPL